MTRFVVRAAVTAAAATLLMCTIVFAGFITVDMAITGLFHLPDTVTYAVGAIALAGTAWLGCWLFRRAYGVECRLEAGQEPSGS